MVEQTAALLRVKMSESSWMCDRTFAGTAEQVRHARAFLARVLDGCPVADDAVLLISELCANAVLHSDSRKAGGTFGVHAEVFEGKYLWAEVTDCGGPWVPRDARADGRGHGLDIVRQVASEWGRDGARAAGWVVWFRLDWPGS